MLHIINTEELKEIQANIEMSPPPYDDLIDKEELKEQIWHYRMENNADRKEAFLNLVKSKIASGLFTWQKSFKQNDEYIRRVEENETMLLAKEDALKEQLEEKERSLKTLELSARKVREKLHQLEEKLIDYSEKFAKNNSMKKITLVMMMVFSLLMAGGTAILLNKIGTKTTEMQRILAGDNVEKEQKVVSVSLGEYEDDGYGNEEEISEKISTEELTQKSITHQEVENKTEWQDTLMFFLYSLIFLALGKVVSIAYEELNHPSWMLYLLVIGVIVITIPLVIITVEQLKNQVTFKEDNITYMKIKTQCQDFEHGVYNENYECVGWKNRKIDTEKLEKLLSDQIVAVNENRDDADDYVQSEGGKASILSFKQQYEDLEKRLYSEMTDILGLQKILMFFAEMLFSSLAWVYFVRTYTSEKMLAKLTFRKGECANDLSILEEKDQTLKSEISDINNQVSMVDKTLKEVLNLKSKLFNTEEIKEKVQLIKEEYIQHSLTTLQEIEAWIKLKLTQGSK